MGLRLGPQNRPSHSADPRTPLVAMSSLVPPSVIAEVPLALITTSTYYYYGAL